MHLCQQEAKELKGTVPACVKGESKKESTAETRRLISLFEDKVSAKDKEIMDLEEAGDHKGLPSASRVHTGRSRPPPLRSPSRAPHRLTSNKCDRFWPRT